MANNDGFRKYVEAAAVLGQLTRARAEEIVRELASAGGVQKEQAQQWVDDLVERSQRVSEELLDYVRREVNNQLSSRGLDPEHLADQVADILRRSAERGRKAAEAARSATTTRTRSGGPTAKTAGATTASTTAATKTAATKTAATKTAATKKSAPKAQATKASAKKATAKGTTTKAPAKKSAAKATAAKATATKAPAKKTTAKKATAKKTTAKKAAPEPGSAER